MSNREDMCENDEDEDVCKGKRESVKWFCEGERK